ncbi:MAG: ATP-binding cassette domain-containing protein [Bacteroidetes bacterium]|nr:ATP-binding cassette domain-containing protein [Bacteroidota bacterium]
MNENLLEVKNVSKFFTDKTALNNISLAVPKGYIFGLLGPNGAGKTTLIRIINQITQADIGSVEINGELLNQKHIRNIGYLPEERGLYKKLKVIKQLEYFAKLRGLGTTDAILKSTEWLKRMELYDVRNKKIEELSKGMQQKVQFIVSVLHSPELLILDEPFSGFDPVNAELLTHEILRLRANGTTILYSTHRMESVEKLCDSMALIHQAEKILDGKVSEIRQQFSIGNYELIVNGNYTPTLEHITILNSEIKDLNYSKLSLSLKNISNNDLIQDVIKQAEVIAFSQSIPSINDIFIKLVTQK